MPSFAQEDAAAMLAGGGSGFHTLFALLADDGTAGGNSAVGGWFSNKHENFAGEVDYESHALLVSAADALIPATLPKEKDALRVRVYGVAAGGADADYVVAAMEPRGNGFVNLRLTPVFIAPVSLALAAPVNLMLPAGAESGRYEITATGAGVELTIISAQNATARIEVNPQGDDVIVDVAGWMQGDYGDVGKAMLYTLDGEILFVANNTANTGALPADIQIGRHRIKRSGGGLPIVETPLGSARMFFEPLPPEWDDILQYNNAFSAGNSGFASFIFGNLFANITDANAKAVVIDAINGGGHYRLRREPLSDAAPPLAEAVGGLMATANGATQIGVVVGGFAAMNGAFSGTSGRDNVRWVLQRRTGISGATGINLPLGALMPQPNPFADTPAFVWGLQRQDEGMPIQGTFLRITPTAAGVGSVVVRADNGDYYTDTELEFTAQ